MKQNNEQQPAELSAYIEALSVSYQPAHSPQETTHWFSTDEVITAIHIIEPHAKVTPEAVFEALHAAGYDFCTPPGTQGLSFKWMFRSR